MILKFRESTISRLERLRKREKEGSEGQEDEKDREIVSQKLFAFYPSLLSFFLHTKSAPCSKARSVTNYAILLLCKSGDRAEKQNTSIIYFTTLSRVPH